jgi:hypothetical protein
MFFHDYSFQIIHFVYNDESKLIVILLYNNTLVFHNLHINENTTTSYHGTSGPLWL